MPLFDGEFGRLINRDAIDNAVDKKSFSGQNIITQPTMKSVDEHNMFNTSKLFNQHKTTRCRCITMPYKL